MPRGYLKDSDYIAKDISNYIRALMREQKISQAKIAEAIDVTQGRVSQKLDSADITLKEFITICSQVKADPEKITNLIRRAE